MSQLYLKYDTIVPEAIPLGKLNLLLVFQVNCPGCFIHALPLAEVLRNKYRKEDLTLIGLSTAFEDFDMNTFENTRAFRESNELVGEAKKAIEKLGMMPYPVKITFPIVFDKMVQSEEFVSPSNIEIMTSQVPAYVDSPEPVKETFRKIMKQQYSKAEKVAYTFSLNLLRGTPSWILFNENKEIIDQWFGHKDQKEVEGIIDEAILAIK